MAEHARLGHQGGEQIGAALALGDAFERGEQQQVCPVEREGLTEARGGGLLLMEALLEEEAGGGEVVGAQDAGLERMLARNFGAGFRCRLRGC